MLFWFHLEWAMELGRTILRQEDNPSSVYPVAMGLSGCLFNEHFSFQLMNIVSLTTSVFYFYFVFFLNVYTISWSVSLLSSAQISHSVTQGSSIKILSRVCRFAGGTPSGFVICLLSLNYRSCCACSFLWRGSCFDIIVWIAFHT